MKHPHRVYVAIFLALASGVTKGETQDGRIATAIDLAKQVDTATLDPSLPRQSFEHWFRGVIDSAGKIDWEVNDCGEQTGNPAVDRNRDFPFCVEAKAALPFGPTVTVMIVVGSERRGVVDAPRVWWIYIEQDAQIQEIDSLARLEMAIASWRDRPAPHFRPPLSSAVDDCCAGLRLPGARDIRIPWSLTTPNYAVEGDFNGDAAVDVAVLLVESGAGAPTLAIFEYRKGRFLLGYRDKLDKVDDVAIEAPQEVVLRLVRRGESWAPEGGDVAPSYPHPFDAIEVSTHKTSPAGGVDTRLHLVYWDGKRYALH